jgi:hypothetical protein
MLGRCRTLMLGHVEFTVSSIMQESYHLHAKSGKVSDAETVTIIVIAGSLVVFWELVAVRCS